MKTSQHLLPKLGLGLGLALAPGFAAAEGESDIAPTAASATLIQPITITLAAGELSFGSLIKNTFAGEVLITLDPNVSNPPTISSDNTAGVTPLEGHAEPLFSVTGEPSRLVQVGVEPSITLQKGAGGTSATEMTVDSFNVDVYDNPGGPNLHDDVNTEFVMPADGTANLELGGVLHVESDDEFGVFSGTVDVTVSYL